MITEIGCERGWSRASPAQFDAMCGPGGVFLISSPDTVKVKIMAVDSALGGVSASLTR